MRKHHLPSRPEWRLVLGHLGRSATGPFTAAALFILLSILTPSVAVFFSARRDANQLFDSVSLRIAALERGKSEFRPQELLRDMAGGTELALFDQSTQRTVAVVHSLRREAEVGIKFRREFQAFGRRWTLYQTRYRSFRSFVRLPTLAISGLFFLAAIALAMRGAVRRQPFEVSANMLESLGDVIAIVSSDGKILYASPSINTVFGYSDDQVVGRNFVDVVASADANSATSLLHRVATGAAWRGTAELRLATPRGMSHVEVDAQRIDAGGRLMGVLVIMHDMTEVLMLERQIEASKRMEAVGRVTAIVAHEFRNLLMAFQTNTDLVRRLAGDNERLKAVSDQLQRSVARGQRIAEEILRFAKPPEPQRSPIVIRDWMNELRAELHSVIGESVALDVRLDDDALAIIGDRQQLAQVLVNVVINAREAMYGRGRIELSIERSSGGTFPFGIVSAGDYAWFRIRDEGPGIPSDAIEHVFEPLFTTKRSGTGLGLAVSYQIVSRHGGSIFIESKLGEGAIVHVFLPAKAKSGATIAA